MSTLKSTPEMTLYNIKRAIKKGNLPTIKILKGAKESGIDIKPYIAESIKLLKELR
jgi:hypothetical protein